MNERRFPDRPMTDAEMEASTAMADGNLVPLVRLLAEENHELHPIVQRALRNLIAGSEHESDWRIFVDIHPGLTDIRHGNRHWLRMTARDQAIALEIANGADFLDGKWMWRGQKESVFKAVEDSRAVNPTKLKRSSLNRIWKEQEPFLRYCIRNGSYLPRNLRPSSGG